MPARSTTVKRELRSIQSALKGLQRSFDKLVPLLAAADAKSRPEKRPITITPARRAQLKLQGQYMGHMRGLKPTQKKKIKRIKETKGIRAAIAAAKRVAD